MTLPKKLCVATWNMRPRNPKPALPKGRIGSLDEISGHEVLAPAACARTQGNFGHASSIPRAITDARDRTLSPSPK